MSHSEITSTVSRYAVTIRAYGGTRRQRGAAIAAEVRRWAPEHLDRVTVYHGDADTIAAPLRHPQTVIRYARNGSHLAYP